MIDDDGQGAGLVVVGGGVGERAICGPADETLEQRGEVGSDRSARLGPHRQHETIGVTVERCPVVDAITTVDVLVGELADRLAELGLGRHAETERVFRLDVCPAVHRGVHPDVVRGFAGLAAHCFDCRFSRPSPRRLVLGLGEHADRQRGGDQCLKIDAGSGCVTASSSATRTHAPCLLVDGPGPAATGPHASPASGSSAKELSARWHIHAHRSARIARIGLRK